MSYSTINLNFIVVSHIYIIPVPIDDSYCTTKRYRYTSAMLPATIYVAYKTYVIYLTPTCDSKPIHLNSSKTPATEHIIMRDIYDSENEKYSTLLGNMTE